MARKRARKKPTKRKPTGWQKCKYVAKRGSKVVANRLARQLKADCYRPLVQAPHSPSDGYTILSCGKLPSCPPKRRKRRKR